jgi:hypothetical protein
MFFFCIAVINKLWIFCIVDIRRFFNDFILKIKNLFFVNINLKLYNIISFLISFSYAYAYPLHILSFFLDSTSFFIFETYYMYVCTVDGQITLGQKWQSRKFKIYKFPSFNYGFITNRLTLVWHIIVKTDKYIDNSIVWFT